MTNCLFHNIVTSFLCFLLSEPDGVPIEAWKAIGTCGESILNSIFKRALLNGKIPRQWRQSIITPVFKGRGSVPERGNYRGIKVTFLTMEHLERIIDSRTRQECHVRQECQYGFPWTIDPVYALRIVTEKFRTKNTQVQVYKTIIITVLLQGCEAWPVLEQHKQELRVTGMNILRWMCGVTRKYCVRNSRIRGSLHVRDIADKLQESRLR